MPDSLLPQVFAESEEFEIKPPNSNYPTTTAQLDAPPTTATAGGNSAVNSADAAQESEAPEGAAVALSARSGLVAVAVAAMGLFITV